MRICLVGNSHLGPIAAAASRDRGSDTGHFISRTYGKVPLKIFGKNHAAVIPEIRIEDKPHVPASINVDDWDAFVVVGCGFSVVRLVEKWTAYQPEALSVELGQYLVPDELYSAYENDIMDSSQAFRIIRQFNEVTDKPVYIVPAPLPAEWAMEREGQRFVPFRKFSDDASRDYLMRRMDFQLARMVENGVTPISQPESTRTGSLWTKTEFCLGQPGDTSEESFYARGDFYHMNKSFGEVYWEEIRRRIHQNFESVVASQVKEDI